MNMVPNNRTGAIVPREIDADAYPSIVALFDAAVERFAGLPAFECFGTRMTYAEIDAAATAFAAGRAGGFLVFFGVAAMASPGERAPDCSGRPTRGRALPVRGSRSQWAEGLRRRAGTIPG